MSGVEIGKESAAEAAAVPLADVLDRVCGELRHLASAVEGLEALVGKLVISDSVSKLQSVYELQALDELRQTLDGLADFLDHVTFDSINCCIDAVAASRVVKLASLSKRLSEVAAIADVSENEEAGQVELFGSVA